MPKQNLDRDIEDVLKANHLKNIPKGFSFILVSQIYQIFHGRVGAPVEVLASTIKKQFPQSDATKIAKDILAKTTRPVITTPPPPKPLFR